MNKNFFKFLFGFLGIIFIALFITGWFQTRSDENNFAGTAVSE